MKRLLNCASLILFAWPLTSWTATSHTAVRVGDKMLAEYFQAETAKVSENCLRNVRTLEDWTSQRETNRQQLLEMLGLFPLPDRSALKPVVTGKVEHELFKVEKLHFQSMPGLYVTANLYLPKNLSKPAPTILYLSGHGPVISNGISYGNKVAYQHHGAWFARNGYVCLLIDTIQLGEIQGEHHGTYRDNMWWWNSLGYTPAGVEAWNSIRALDYLSTRREVDTNRFGVTGRSGGGAYSWWTAALADRIKVAAPVAGITDLRNHVVDGAVEGHCDCMFMVNTYRWDYPEVAALVAPRPLMIANSDSDSIFPLDGVERLHRKVKYVYDSYNATTNLALLITDGPHKDTQDLQLPVFRWFNRKLKNEDPLIEMAAIKFFTPEQLKVFEKLPDDTINKTIAETFIPRASTNGLQPADWEQKATQWTDALQRHVFNWPSANPVRLNLRFAAERESILLRGNDFLTQPGVRLRLYLFTPTGSTPLKQIVVNVLNAETNALPELPTEAIVRWDDWSRFLNAEFHDELNEERFVATNAGPNRIDFQKLKTWMLRNNSGLAFVAPRGLGINAWTADERAQTHLRRRFMLLGQTVDAMRVWDIRQAVQMVRQMTSSNAVIRLQAEGYMAANSLYASLFVPGTELHLWNLPASHRYGPDYLNVLRYIDIPQAVYISQRKNSVHLHGPNPKLWQPVLDIANAQTVNRKPALFLE